MSIDIEMRRIPSSKVAATSRPISKQDVNERVKITAATRPVFDDMAVRAETREAAPQPPTSIIPKEENNQLAALRRQIMEIDDYNGFGRKELPLFSIKNLQVEDHEKLKGNILLLQVSINLIQKELSKKIKDRRESKDNIQTWLESGEKALGELPSDTLGLQAYKDWFANIRSYLCWD